MNLFSPLKKRSIFYILILIALVAFLLSDQSKSLFGTKEFSIQIENTDSQIKLTCSEGCDWKTLSFSAEENQTQLIDNTGMSTSGGKGSENAKFLFKIRKKKNAVFLKGMEGTAWTQMEFRLRDNESKTIDQDGIVGY